MVLALVTLITALGISAVAAFYSIVGLMAIFSASALSIAIMGIVLEIGKLITASWLYQNWKRVPFLLKSYLTIAVIILMFITSMGIFGYLSKAHIDQGSGTKPYQGITPLAGGSLSKCAETYFAQSEQLPTRFKTITAQETRSDVDMKWRAGGIMVQHMPKASPSIQKDGGSGEGGLLQADDLLSDDDAENWNRATILMDSAEETELIGPHVGQEQLLHRLFHQETPRIFPAQPIKFGCTCCEEKVRQTMSIYSIKDIKHMTADNGMVTADCQFCGAHYELEPSTLGKDAVNES